MANWWWDQGARRYRDGSGRFLAQETVLAYRDKALAATERGIAQLVDDLDAGRITAQGFRDGMRRQIKLSYGAEYVYGRGGFRNMTPRDWGILGADVKRQYKYLDRFVDAIEADDLSIPQIRARANLYGGGAVQSYERGYASSWDVELPGHPGDGGTPCYGNCRCSWRLEMGEDGAVLAYWELGGDDPCKGCRARASAWYPYETKPISAQ